MDTAPNPWAVIEEFSKSVVTLGSALLGLTVTFSSTLVGKAGGSSAMLWALFSTWGLSLAAVALGVATHAYVVRYLKNGMGARSAALCANLAFTCLVLAGIAFTSYAIANALRATRLDDAALVDRALANAPKLVGEAGGQWMVRRFVRNASANTFEVSVTSNGSKPTLQMTMDAEGTLIQAEMVEGK